MDIQLAKCKLRLWNARDVIPLARHANNIKIASVLRDVFPSPYTIKDAEFFISHVANCDSRQIIFAIEVENEAIGSIGAHIQNDVYKKNAEVGYWLSEKYWGQGIATNALNGLVEYIFTNFEIFRVYAAVFENNPASMRVLEKCGFKQEAVHKFAVVKNNQLMDELIFTRYNPNGLKL